MSSKSDQLLIIYAHEARSLESAQLAAQLGVDNPQIIEGILKAKDEIELGQKAPPFIVIDIGERDKSVLEELDMLAHVCPASTRVVVTGAINDISFTEH